MKWFKNILLIPLHVIDLKIFTIFSLRSYGYAPQKLSQFKNQAHTNHFNIHS